jgi:hypothetical protein
MGLVNLGYLLLEIGVHLTTFIALKHEIITVLLEDEICMAHYVISFEGVSDITFIQ